MQVLDAKAKTSAMCVYDFSDKKFLFKGVKPLWRLPDQKSGP